MTVEEWLGADNEIGINIVKNKYLKNGETFDAWIDRVSNGDEALKAAILNKDFLFGGRTLSNRGIADNKSSLFNCNSYGYLVDTLDGIMDACKDLAITFKAQGGQGISLSLIRPKGAPIGKHYTSDGIIPFIELLDKTTGTVRQGGSRKGALMISIDARHKEVEDFIKIKSNQNQISNANLSLEVDDKFMSAVSKYYTNNKTVVLHEKREYGGHVVEYDVTPINIFKLMVQNCYEWAEPGCLYIDKFRNYNLMQHDSDYNIITSNPCFHPDTIIETVNGCMKIKDITQPTKVYSMDNNGSLVIKQASASFITKRNTQTLNIHISNGKILRTTPEHKIYTKNRGWVKAKDLIKNDIPVALLRNRRGAKYCGIRLSTQGNRDYVMEHRLVYGYCNGAIPEGYDIHHKNNNTYDNVIDNLELISHSKHATLTRYSCPNNHMVRCPKTKRFISHENSKFGEKTIVNIPEHLKSGFKTIPRITAVTEGEITDVYDIKVDETHNLVANGIIAHNCGEQPLPAHGACCLGSINLSNCVVEPFTSNAKFNWNRFRELIDTGVKALDVLIDENSDRHPLEQQKEMSINYRNIGLGVMGYASMLMRLGIVYGSKESKEFTEKLFNFFFRKSVFASNRLAKEQGTFPKYSEVVLNSDIIKNHFSGVEISNLKQYGLRNASLLSIAPTGTISTLIGVSGGCEPEFAISYTRKTEGLHSSEKYYNIYCKTAQDYLDIVGGELPEYFVSATDISWRDRVEIQSIMQNSIDTAISSTVNLKNSISLEEVEHLYLYAWSKGLKGITIFRDGCSKMGILTTNSQSGDDVVVEQTLQRGDIIQVDDNVVGRKRLLQTGCGSLHCSAFFDSVDGKLLEVFLSKGSQGGCNSFMIGLSRMISLATRGGIEMESIIDQLRSAPPCLAYDRKKRSTGASKGLCCPDAIANALQSMYDEIQSELFEQDEVIDDSGDNRVPQGLKDIAVKITTYTCPECKEPVVFEGGCFTCKNCGYSKCG